MQYTKDVLYKIKALERVLFTYIKIIERDDSMEKIILKNGQEFESIPNGIETNEFTKRRIFKFISDLPYDEVKTSFKNSSNIDEIDYILSDGSRRTYIDCAKLKELSQQYGVSVDEETQRDIYIAVISTDILERDLQKVKENIIYTEIALTEVYESMIGGGL
jgi:hypothetical protein